MGWWSYQLGRWISHWLVSGWCCWCTIQNPDDLVHVRYVHVRMSMSASPFRYIYECSYINMIHNIWLYNYIASYSRYVKLLHWDVKSSGEAEAREALQQFCPQILSSQPWPPNFAVLGRSAEYGKLLLSRTAGVQYIYIFCDTIFADFILDLPKIMQKISGSHRSLDRSDKDQNCRLQVFFREEAHGANVSMDSSFQSVRNEALEQELEAWKLEARWVEEFTWKSKFKALRQEQSRKSAAEATGFKGLFESVEMDAALKTYKHHI